MAFFKDKTWSAAEAAGWEQTKKRGKLQFVLLHAAVDCLCITIFISAAEYLFADGGFRPGSLWVKVPAFFIGSIVAALLSWAGNEKNYRNAKTGR